MFKKFLAFTFVAILCVGLFMPVALMDDNPGDCTHTSQSPSTICEYVNINGSQHQVNAYPATVCNLCGKKSKTGAAPVISFEKHRSLDNKLYDYHMGNNHYFYKVCFQCNGRFEQEVLICPGGNNHVNPND